MLREVAWYAGTQAKTRSASVAVFLLLVSRTFLCALCASDILEGCSSSSAISFSMHISSVACTLHVRSRALTSFAFSSVLFAVLSYCTFIFLVFRRKYV